MVTLLPVVSFVKSMEFLDERDLNTQRIEAAAILEILTNSPILPRALQPAWPLDKEWPAWSSHPAILMWKGHEEWLKLYIACAVGEWCSRGHYNILIPPKYSTENQGPPSWLGLEEFHKSHRSYLIRRNPLHYLKFWPDEERDLSLFWPSDAPALV